MQSNPNWTTKKEMTKLRGKVDLDDSFMMSHQIKWPRVLIGQKDTPLWAASDKEVRRVLLQSFPNLASDQRHRKSAARWSHAIVLVYRIGMPYNHAAAEMGINVGTLRSLLRNIRRVAQGLRADTKTPRIGSRGRPKKV